MKIIILGAGQVGTTLASHLATEHNDITIIDKDGDKLRTLHERMDILTITGNGAYPNVLKKGSAEKADILIAVTSSDEVNLVACQIAYTLFNIPTKIARIRSLQYLAHPSLFGEATAFPIDELISPEQLVSNYILKLIQYPNALQVLDFADQKIQLVAVKTKKDNGPIVGCPLKDLKTHLPEINTRVVAIYRKGDFIQPTAETTIEPFDEVYFLVASEHVRDIMSELVHLDEPHQRIMIAGGGNIGTRLAQALEQHFQIKVIEQNPIRSEFLATELSNGVVLQGDASDKELLINENVADMDVFCAVTNNDEINIMSAKLAKYLGAKKVMALVSRPSYIDVIEGGNIDIAISPQQVTVGSLLTHVRRGNVVNVHSLRRGTAEAIEVSVPEGSKNSKVIGKAIKDIPLPGGAMIGAIVRGEQVLLGEDTDIIEANDRIIIFLSNKHKIRQVESLFSSKT